jgi:hypothetical protein
MNMTPNGPGIEAWSRKTPGTWTKDVEACATRSSILTVEKTTLRAHMWKGESQQLTEKRRGAKWGRTRLKRARFMTPFDLDASLYIASASAGRHIDPFIRELPTRRRSTGRKPTVAASPRRCQGDGLG